MLCEWLISPARLKMTSARLSVSATGLWMSWDRPDLAGGWDDCGGWSRSQDLESTTGSGPKFQEPDQVAPNESQAARYDSPFVRKLNLTFAGSATRPSQ
jgi:hypothetical protein